MNLVLSLVAVSLLALVGFVGAKANLTTFFGVIVPYLAVLIFLGGIVYRVVRWAMAPVPFRIPSTCGQQKSMDFIKHDRLESPFTTLEVIARMALEVLFFRSLFRNTKASIEGGKRLTFGTTKWLWGASLVFHWCFLIILVRHFRFFAEPVPMLINLMGDLDSFFEIGLPLLYLTDVGIMLGLTYLFLRRVVLPQIRYISLAADYFPLVLILGIVISGIVMRYFWKVDVVGVKALTMGLMSLSLAAPQGIGALFYVHLFLVCALLAYFPFSKLTHAPGVFLSPTRNLANNSRWRRHVNPWNDDVDVHVHTWDEYCEEFKDKMEACGMLPEPKADGKEE